MNQKATTLSHVLPGPHRGIGRFKPPADPLRTVFPPEIMAEWRKRPTRELVQRLEILCACGPYPSDAVAAAKLRRLRARKAAWETYLLTAFACGLFEGSRGNDLRGRLTSADPDDFRSAMAECLVCWFLAGRMKLPVDSAAAGRNGRTLDMRLVTDQGDIGVEVKAPFRALPKPPPGKRTVSWCGDDSDKIAQALESANKQFDDATANILVLVPQLRTRMFSNRKDLLKAAFGQSKITCQINMATGEIGPTEVKFFPDGKFLNTDRPGGKPLKPDGFPAYRRISAMVCIEEKIAEKYPFPDPLVLLDEEARGEMWPPWKRACDVHFSAENEAWIEHDVLVLHNPHAYYLLPQQMWEPFPQLVPVGDNMEWTDGEEVIL